jgi:hypothetical protein
MDHELHNLRTDRLDRRNRRECREFVGGREDSRKVECKEEESVEGERLGCQRSRSMPETEVESIEMNSRKKSWLRLEVVARLKLAMSVSKSSSHLSTLLRVEEEG